MNKLSLVAAIAVTIVGSSLGSSLLQKDDQGGGAVKASIGEVIGVYKWEFEPAGQYSKQCTVNGIVRYKLQTESKISGRADGSLIGKDFNDNWLSGQVISGVGFVDVHVSEYSEEACKFKSSTDLQFTKWEITIVPGYVLKLDQE